MTERAIVFGPRQALVGVVAIPEDSSASRKRAVIMANIGLHHRVGPYRLYVDLARRLATRGLVALRFDLSGLGDSAPRQDMLSDAERGASDMGEAMDWLATKLGVEEFLLIALCSGVDTAHLAALRDPRVAGAVFIDGYTYTTVRSTLRRHTIRYLQLERWIRYGRRAFAALRAKSRREERPADGPAIFVREYPTRARFRADIAQMAGRGMKLLFIWTGTYQIYNARTQLFEMLGRDFRRTGIEVDYMRGADHVFSACEHRAVLLDRIERWATDGGPAT